MNATKTCKTCKAATTAANFCSASCRWAARQPQNITLN